jgi:hypothetical protein
MFAVEVKVEERKVGVEEGHVKVVGGNEPDLRATRLSTK